jgi:hypothetical protein
MEIMSRFCIADATNDSKYEKGAREGQVDDKPK